MRRKERESDRERERTERGESGTNGRETKKEREKNASLNSAQNEGVKRKDERLPPPPPNGAPRELLFKRAYRTNLVDSFSSPD